MIWGKIQMFLNALFAPTPRHMATARHLYGNPYGYAQPTERKQRAARLEKLQSQLDALTVTLARAHKLRRNKQASSIEAEIKTIRNAIFKEGPPT